MHNFLLSSCSRKITWISLIHPYPYFINTTVLETALWENFWETTTNKKDKREFVHTLIYIFKRCKQLCQKQNNAHIFLLITRLSNAYISGHTQSKIPNPLVTAAPPNAELISNFHTSSISLCNWTDPLWFFCFSLFSSCIINCHKNICLPLEKIGNSNCKIKMEKLFMLFGKINYER